MTNWRYSKFFRITAFFVLLDFLFSQSLFAQDQFQVQERTHLYTPVKEIDAERLDENGTGSEGLPVPFSEDHLPNPADFWNESRLSLPTPENSDISSPLVGEDEGGGNDPPHPNLPPQRGEGEVGDYDFDFYSFEDALHLIRPEFAAAIPIMGFVSDGLKVESGAYGF